MQEIIRGTTPTVTVTVGTDLTGWTAYMTFEHSRGILTKSGDDVTVTATTVACRLTQEDTLSFPEGGLVKVQVLWVDAVGDVVGTKCDENSVFRVLERLLEDEIPLEG